MDSQYDASATAAPGTPHCLRAADERPLCKKSRVLSEWLELAYSVEKLDSMARSKNLAAL
jgi:hypothetical protein